LFRTVFPLTFCRKSPKRALIWLKPNIEADTSKNCKKYFTSIKKKSFSADLVARDKDIRQSVENEGILLEVGKAANGVRAGGSQMTPSREQSQG
jgi:hypothetical protein